MNMAWHDENLTLTGRNYVCSMFSVQRASRDGSKITKTLISLHFTSVQFIGVSNAVALHDINKYIYIPGMHERARTE